MENEAKKRPRKTKKLNEEELVDNVEEKLMSSYSIEELYNQFEKAIFEKLSPSIKLIMAQHGIKSLHSDVLKTIIRIIFKDFRDTLCELIKIARIRNLTNYLFVEPENGKVVSIQPTIPTGDIKCSPFDIVYTSDPKSQFQLLEKIETIKASEKAKVDQEKIKSEDFKGRSKKNKEKISVYR